MPLEKITSDCAFGSLKSNESAKYPRPDSGSERLFPFPVPTFTPTFQIKPDAKIFTMGSCFAREVDKALSRTGFSVISRSAELDKTVERSGNDESLYNKYTIHSILNEVRWALDPGCPYRYEQALLQVGEDRWEDPQLGGHSFNGALGEMLAFRNSYCNSMKRIAEADVVIITLGLVEAWFDTQSGLYMNMAPPPRLAKSQPGRFELHVLEYHEIVEALEQIHALVTTHGKSGVRFLVTVSPVPLLATFRDQDVLVANTYSKSVQRAAVEKFVLSHDDVNYFPSYEFVVLGDPKTNWTHDYRHVHPKLVERIMTSVMLRYTPNDSTEGAAISTEIHAAYSCHDFDRVISLANRIDNSLLQPMALYRVGLSYKKKNRDTDALAVFQKCLLQDGSAKAALENAIHLAHKLNHTELLLKFLKAHEEKFPKAGDFRLKFQ